MKRQQQKRLFISLVLFSLFFASACLKEKNGAVTTGSIEFLESTYGVRAILDSKCAKCHAPGKTAAEEWLYDVSDYERSLKKNIQDIHKLTQNSNAEMARAQYGNLSQEEINKLNQWYQAGYPTEAPTAKVAFTHNVMKPFFDAQCASCHSAGNSNAASWLYDPTDYNISFKNTISALRNATLIKKTMPPGKTLTITEIDNITKWFDAGAPATN